MTNKRFRYFENGRYELFFDTKTGVEILKGMNDSEDPFSLILPSLLDIGIMGTCKNKCKFCYQGHVNRPNMKLDDFKRIIDEVAYHTNQVALGGRGDPNHHPNFKEILEYCRHKNVVPNYTTSGIDITDEQIEISKMCGAVAVSEYQQPYTYDAVRRLMSAGLKTNIHYIFSSKTFNNCISLLDGHHYIWGPLIDINKLNAVIFLLFKPQGAGKELTELVPTVNQFKIMSKKVFKSKAKFKIGIDSCLANHITKHTKLTKAQKLTVQTCEASRMSAYISPSMNLMPCSFANEELFGKPIKTIIDIHRIWTVSKPFMDFRKQLFVNESECPLKL